MSISSNTHPASVLLLCLLAAPFMAVLDVAVANIALPSIQNKLHASGVQLQFVTAGYIAAYAILLIPGARLGNMFGYRRMFLGGVLLFTVMSAACGMASTPTLLIAERVLQGLGAALFMPQVLSVIQHTFADQARVRALSLYATVLAGGAVAGQILGGVLVAGNLWGLQWRPVFLVNVPVGLLLLVASRRLIPQDRAGTKDSLDIKSVLSLSATLLLLVLPVTLGHELGWPAWTWLSLAGSAVSFAAFIFSVRCTEKRGGHPLVARRLLRSEGFSPATIAIILAMAGYGGVLFLMSLYVQTGLGRGPLATGLAFLPSALAFGVTSLNWRKLPADWHNRLAPVGLLLVSISLLGLAGSMATSSISLGMELAIFGFGTGMGLSFSPLFAVALTHVDTRDSADASGVLTTANQLGQVLGIAGYGTLLFMMAQRSGIVRGASVTALAMAGGGGLAGIIAWTSVSRPIHHDTHMEQQHHKSDNSAT